MVVLLFNLLLQVMFSGYSCSSGTLTSFCCKEAGYYRMLICGRFCKFFFILVLCEKVL